MRRKLMPLLVGLIFTLLFVCFQNFGVVGSMPGLSKLKHERQGLDEKSIERVESFYQSHRYLQHRSFRYYNGPKDYLKSKVKESHAYQKVKSWVEIEDKAVYGEPQIACEGEDCPSEEVGDASDMKIRYNPLKAKAEILYDDGDNTAFAFSQKDDTLHLKVLHTISPSHTLQVEHEMNEEKTFVNYLLNW